MAGLVAREDAVPISKHGLNLKAGSGKEPAFSISSTSDIMSSNDMRTYLMIILFSGSIAVSGQNHTAYSFAEHGNGPVPEKSSSPVAAIHFEAYGTLVIIPVRVNGSSELSFILDTGVKATQINSKLLTTITLPKNRKTTISVGNQVLDNIEVHTPSFDDLESALGRHIDGIFGFDLFRRFVVETDYSNQIVKLYEPNRYVSATESTKVKLKIDGGVPIAQCELEFQSGKKFSREFEVDSGLTGAVEIYGTLAQSEHLLAAVGPTIANWAWNVGGQYEERIGRLKSIRLGSYTLQGPIVSLPAAGAKRTGSLMSAGFIGGDILQRFKVILDYNHRLMILVPDKDFADPFEWDMSGLFVDALGSKFSTYQISGVLDGSPASEAGLREGDVLVAINDRPAAEFDLPTIEKMFKQEGKEFHLQIRRGEQFLNTNIKTRQLI